MKDIFLSELVTKSGREKNEEVFFGFFSREGQ